METALPPIGALFALAFACAYVDTTLGMGYGTILTPVLVLLGIETGLAVPAVLFSQGIGGLAASFFHHRFRNVSFHRGSVDRRVALIIGSLGTVAAVTGAFVSVQADEVVVRTYIGSLIVVVGLFVVLERTLKFSWRKIVGIGLLSAFNKGFAGGGFGPVVTGGQVLSGRDVRASVGVTSLVNVPICLSAFLAYAVASRQLASAGAEAAGLPPTSILLPLLAGTVLAAPFGTLTTRRAVQRRFRRILGAFIVGLGFWILVRTWA